MIGLNQKEEPHRHDSTVRSQRYTVGMRKHGTGTRRRHVLGRIRKRVRPRSRLPLTRLPRLIAHVIDLFDASGNDIHKDRERRARGQE